MSPLIRTRFSSSGWLRSNRVCRVGWDQIESIRLTQTELNLSCWSGLNWACRASWDQIKSISLTRIKLSLSGSLGLNWVCQASQNWIESIVLTQTESGWKFSNQTNSLVQTYRLGWFWWVDGLTWTTEHPYPSIDTQIISKFPYSQKWWVGFIPLEVNCGGEGEWSCRLEGSSSR